MSKKHPHPLESVFDMPSPDDDITDDDSIDTPLAVADSTDVEPVSTYDRKDNDVDKKFDEIYDISLEAFEAQAEEAELVDGRFKARNHEIAAQYLTIALNAAANKATLKVNKDKLTIAAAKVVQKGTTTANGSIVGNRNEILQALRAAKKQKAKEDITDGEFTDQVD